MTGPFPAEPHDLRVDATAGAAGLALNEAYRVIAPFADADGTAHAVGETWSVAAVWFNELDNTIVIVACFDGPDRWRIPLSLGDDAQRDVIEHPERYLEADASPPATADAIASWGRTLARMWRTRFPRKRA